MSRFQIIFITFGIIIFLAAGIAFFAMRSRPVAETNMSNAASVSLASPVVSSAEETALSSSDLELFVHPSLPFSFSYPAQFTINSFTEENGAEVVIAERSGKNGVFQIYIAPFDEEGALTKERISRDVSDMAIDDPQTALIGSEKTPALLFWGNDSTIGKTREVWFAREGYLYQVSAAAALDNVLTQVMATWRFE